MIIRDKFFKAFLPLLAILAIFFSSGCAKKLATYENGSVNQKDLEKWVELYLPEQKNRILASLDMQRRLVKQIVSLELAKRAALAQNYDQDDEFNLEWEFVKMQHIADRFRRQIIEENESNPNYSDEIVHARHILFKIENTPEPGSMPETIDDVEKEKRYAQALVRAQEVEKKLQQGQDFSEMAKKHSEGPSKSEGGDLGFFTRRNMMVEPFAEAAFGLEKGQVSPPVKTRFGYHLIKLEDKVTVNPQNISDILPVEQERKRIESNIKQGQVDKRVEGGEKTMEINVDLAKFKLAKPDDVIMKIGNYQLTKKMLEEKTREYFSREIGLDQKISDDILDVTINGLKAMLVLAHLADEDGFSSSSSVRDSLAMTYDQALANYFMKQLRKSVPPVTEQEAEAEYNKRFDSKGMKNNMRQTMTKKPFSEMKDGMMSNMQRQKEEKAMRDWMDNAFKDNNFKLIDDNFRAADSDPNAPSEM